MNECCFRARYSLVRPHWVNEMNIAIGHCMDYPNSLKPGKNDCKAILGRGEANEMDFVMNLVQNRSLYLLTSSRACYHGCPLPKPGSKSVRVVLL